MSEVALDSGAPVPQLAAPTDQALDLSVIAWTYISGRYEALGHHFAVRTTDPYLGSHLETLFRPFAVTAPVGGASVYSVFESESGTDELPFRLYRDGEHLGSFRECHAVLSGLLWHLNRAVIRDTTDHLLVHASAAEWHGATLIFPAPMESGKTTLIAGLVRAGFRYVTDEAVAIQPESLKVTPFPRALSVDPGSWEVLRDLRPVLHPAVERYQGNQWQVTPDSIRPGAVAPPSRPKFIISPRYRAGGNSVLTPMRRAAAVQLLGENAFNFQDFGDTGLRVLASVARGSSCYRLEIGDLDQACGLVGGLLAGGASVRGGERS